MTTVGALTGILAGHYPPPTAEPWDRVGLAVGDPAATVERVWCTVDVTDEVIADAIEGGAQLIVSHHPLLLRGVNSVTTTDPKGRMVSELIRNGIALWTAHTNADIAHRGVATSLADALGLVDQRPLDRRDLSPMLSLTVYVPIDDVATVVDAVTAAGAGTVGDYDRCHWSTEGTGSFRPLAGAQPHIGAVDEVTEVREARVDLVLPRARRGAVLSALLGAHPYEEPAFHLTEIDTGDDDRGLGRIGQLAQPMTLADFVDLVHATIPQTPAGVRAAGDPGQLVSSVALLPGAGDSLLDTARAAGVDVYMTSDLRHHPAQEFLAWGGPALVDIPHWAAEWMWLPTLAAVIREAAPKVDVRVSERVTDPWTVVRS